MNTEIIFNNYTSFLPPCPVLLPNLLTIRMGELHGKYNIHVLKPSNGVLDLVTLNSDTQVWTVLPCHMYIRLARWYIVQL